MSTGRVAQFVAYLTHGLKIAGSIPSCGKLSFSVRFRLSPLMHVRSSHSHCKECCVSTGARKPENTWVCHGRQLFKWRSSVCLFGVLRRINSISVILRRQFTNPCFLDNF